MVKRGSVGSEFDVRENRVMIRAETARIDRRISNGEVLRNENMVKLRA